MRTLFRWILLMAIALVVLSGLSSTLLLHSLAHIPDISISINGEALDLADLEWAPFSATLLGLMVAGLVVCVVLPLVLLLGIGLPLLIVAGMLGVVLAMMLGLGTLLGSPVIVIGLILWLLLRPRRAPRAPRT